MSEALILTHREIESVSKPEMVLSALREGFILANGKKQPPGHRFPFDLSDDAPANASGMLLAPGLIPGIPAYSVKIHAKYPDDEQPLKGLILLNALEDGQTIAILESTWLTNLRTGYAGAVGADVLARKEAKSVGIIGAGTQARLQLECLTHIRRIEEISVFDIVQENALLYAKEAKERYGINVTIANSVGECVQSADIIVTATWSIDPFLEREMVRPGTHITTLGADQPDEAELCEDLIKASLFIADDADLAVEMGAIGGVGLSHESIHATLGQVLAGDKTGRTSEDQITIFGSVGMPFQDLVVSWAAYTAAMKQGVGRSLNFMD